LFFRIYSFSLQDALPNCSSLHFEPRFWMPKFSDGCKGFSQALERHDHARTDDREPGKQEEKTDDERRDQEIGARFAEHALDRPLDRSSTRLYSSHVKFSS